MLAHCHVCEQPLVASRPGVRPLTARLSGMCRQATGRLAGVAITVPPTLTGRYPRSFLWRFWVVAKLIAVAGRPSLSRPLLKITTYAGTLVSG